MKPHGVAAARMHEAEVGLLGAAAAAAATAGVAGRAAVDERGKGWRVLAAAVTMLASGLLMGWVLVAVEQA